MEECQQIIRASFTPSQKKCRYYGGTEPDNHPRILHIGWSMHETFQSLLRKMNNPFRCQQDFCVTFTCWLLEVFPYFYSDNCKVIWENQLQIQSHETKRAHSRQFVRAKKLPFPQQEFQKKKRGLNKKVTSAVFRAWTDKQRKFYMYAKCNLTLQTTSIHWNILPPITVQRKVPRT